MAPSAALPPAYQPYRSPSNLSHHGQQRSSHDHQPLQEGEHRPKPYAIPPFFPPSFARSSTAVPAASATPRMPPSLNLPAELEASLAMPPYRQPDGFDRLAKGKEAETRPATARPTYNSALPPATLLGLGPTQHPDFPSQLFSYPPSVQQTARPGAGEGLENQQSLVQRGENRGLGGLSQESHWSPVKKVNHLQDEASYIRDAQHTANAIPRHDDDQGTIHAPKPSRAIDLQGMNHNAGRKESARSTPPTTIHQTASQLPRRRQRELEDEEGRRMLEEGSNFSGGDSKGDTLRDHWQPPMQASRKRSSGDSQAQFRPTTPLLYSQSQFQPRMPAQTPSRGVEQARVDSYHPSQTPARPPSSRRMEHPTEHRQAYAPPSNPAPPASTRQYDPSRSASTHPFGIPTMPRMTAMPDMRPPMSTPDPQPVWRPAVSNLGLKIKNPAELFMAAATQQVAGEGKAKTTSERILARIDECFGAFMAQISNTTAIQQQTRDQLHDLKLGQKAMATREEIVEDMVGQLTPALHESFQALTTSLARLISSIPSASADETADKIKALLLKIRRDAEAGEEEDEAARKPFAKLVKHLISKLDGVSDIVAFLEGCKDLPEALRDVAVYKQSLDAMTAMTKQLPQGNGAASPRSVQEMYAELKGSLHGIEQKLSGDQAGAVVGTGRGEGGVLGEILSRLEALDKRFDQTLAGSKTLPAPTVTSHADSISLGDKVDRLTNELASLKGLITDHITKPPQLDIPSIVAQLRQAIMAPAVDTPPSDNLAGGGPDITAYSQAFQATQIGPAHIPAHQMMTPMTIQRPGGQPDNAVQGGYAFTPYDWQQSGYGAMNMNVGNGLAGGSGGMDGSHYTDIAQAQVTAAEGRPGGDETIGFMNMQQQRLMDHTFSFGHQHPADQMSGFAAGQGAGQATADNGQYDDNGKVAELVSKSTSSSATATLNGNKMGNHPISAFRSGQLEANRTGTGVRSNSGSEGADVFGKVRNIAPTFSTAALPFPYAPTQPFAPPVSDIGNTGAPLDPLEAQASWTPVLVPETAVNSLAPTSADDKHATEEERVREDDESSVDDYADMFNEAQAKQASTPRTASRSTSRGNARGTRGGIGSRGPSAGSGRGRRAKHSAPSTPAATSATPLLTPAVKRPRIDHNTSPNRRSSSVAPFSQVQPVASRTRRSSVLIAPDHSMHGRSPAFTTGSPNRVLTPSSKGRHNLPEDALDRFGAPRRLSDRKSGTARPNYAESSTTNSSGDDGGRTSPAKLQSKVGQRKESKGSKDASNSSGSPVFTSASNTANAAAITSKAAEKRVPTSHGRPVRGAENGREAAVSRSSHLSSRASSQSTRQEAPPVTPTAQEENLEETQSLELPKAPQPNLSGITGSGRKAVTYAGRKRRAIDIGVDDSASSG